MKYPVWSPDDRYIAFRSMATPGYEADKERLMRYDCRTAEITDLTPSFDYHATNVAWADDRTLWFIAPMEGTYQLCRLALPAPPTPRAAPSTCRRSSRRATTTSTPSRWPADASSPK